MGRADPGTVIGELLSVQKLVALAGSVKTRLRSEFELPELIGRNAFSDRIRTRVVRAAHGDSSGVRGAASLWPIKKT